MADNLTAAVRTIIAGLVGALITWLATKGIDLSGGLDEALTVVLFAGFTGLYNGLVNWLQARYGKAWGLLLGIPRLPAYTQPDR